MFVLLALLVNGGGVYAAQVEDLFQARVEAAGRDSASRDAALGRALEEVLVRVSGDRDIAAVSEARSLLREPGRFVQQYRFEGDADSGLRLWAQFDGVSLAKEMRRLSLPFWGENRPPVLVWLAVNEGGQRYLVSDSDGRSAARALRFAESEYAMPLKLPRLDAEDRERVSIADVWGGFADVIEAGSRRYATPLILRGRVEPGGGEWRAEWSLIGDWNDQRWTTRGRTQFDAVQQGVGEMLARLARRYAVVDGASGARAVSVEGIDTLEGYARVYNYLASLTPVEQVAVTHVVGDRVVFDVQLNARDGALERLIDLGTLLQSVPDAPPWHFRFSP